MSVKKTLFFVFLSVLIKPVAQVADTSKIVSLKEVTVTSFKEEEFEKSSLNIIAIDLDSLSKSGSFNLTDLLAKTPGVSMLSTGVAISKPVIRGLYGNRVLCLLSGMKFDNQQWQEEHGMGLSDLGLGRVELIKGPLSVLYGSEALGGVINLIEENKAAFGKKESDVGFKFNSNTLGGTFQAGYKVNRGKDWFRIRFGADNNADYSNGKNERVVNSRFDGYYLKSTYGFIRKRWTSTNNYMGSFNRFGFIFGDAKDFIIADSRWSRKQNENPDHLVLLNILSSENKIILRDSSKINFNIGLQSNQRMENEGGGAISLNMLLITSQYLFKWEKAVSPTQRIILSNLFSFENNTNFGARKIIPDAVMQESNVSFYLESTRGKNWTFENGIGFGEKWIKTRLTPTVNTPDKDIRPFSKFAPYYNAFTGFSFFPSERFYLKANIATGVRIANLAELSSNGLHEGVFTYEIGDPDMKNEQLISGNLYLNLERKFFTFTLSPFYNYFFNYIYLAPTNETWFGFPVYRYFQQNASQYGTEATLSLKLSKNIKLNGTYSGMISKTDDGNYTPFLPAQKITPGIYVAFPVKKNFTKLSAFVNSDFLMMQGRLAPFEKFTPSYYLLNAGISGNISGKVIVYDISISGNNLLNEAYFDHLSRLKNYGLLNIGRNISINLKLKWNKNTNQK